MVNRLVIKRSVAFTNVLLPAVLFRLIFFTRINFGCLSQFLTTNRIRVYDRHCHKCKNILQTTLQISDCTINCFSLLISNLRLLIGLSILTLLRKLSFTHSMAYGIRRFYAAFIRVKSSKFLVLTQFFFKIHSNIVLLSTPRSSYRSLNG